MPWLHTHGEGAAIVRMITITGALLFVTTCSDVLGPDVQLEVTLSQDVVRPSENVTIWITVHNAAEQAVSLGDRCPPLGYRVLDEEGRRVGPTFNWESSFVCVGEIDNSVPAEGSKMYGFLWAPFFNYGSTNIVLPAGMYQIFAGFAGEPLRPPLSDRVTIEVRAD